MDIPATPLTYPAPYRCSHQTERGYYTAPWTVEDVIFAIGGGAYFVTGEHQFANKRAALIATFE